MKQPLKITFLISISIFSNVAFASEIPDLLVKITELENLRTEYILTSDESIDIESVDRERSYALNKVISSCGEKNDEYETTRKIIYSRLDELSAQLNSDSNLEEEKLNNANLNLITSNWKTINTCLSRRKVVLPL